MSKMPVNTPTEKLVEAYFKGGNAKDIKDSKTLRAMLETIKSFTFNEDHKEAEKMIEEWYKD